MGWEKGLPVLFFSLLPSFLVFLPLEELFHLDRDMFGKADSCHVGTEHLFPTNWEVISGVCQSALSLLLLEGLLLYIGSSQWSHILLYICWDGERTGLGVRPSHLDIQEPPTHPTLQECVPPIWDFFLLASSERGAYRGDLLILTHKHSHIS
jgi:hypothetical protein